MEDTIELDTMDSGAYDRRSERARLARDNLSLTSDLKQLSNSAGIADRRAVGGDRRRSHAV